MFPVVRHPARTAGRLVRAAAVSGWLAAALGGLSDSAAQQPLLQQAGQAGAAVVRKVVIGQPGGPTGGLVGKAEQYGESGLRKVTGQPAAPPGSPTGGVVGRVEQVGENAVRKVIGAPAGSPASSPAPATDPLGSPPPSTPPGTSPSAPQPQGGLLGSAQQAGSAVLNKNTGSSSGGTLTQRAVTGAKTLAQQALSKRRNTTPSQAPAPQPQTQPQAMMPQAQPQAVMPQPRPPSGPRPAGAPPM